MLGVNRRSDGQSTLDMVKIEKLFDRRNVAHLAERGISLAQIIELADQFATSFFEGQLCLLEE